MENNTNDTNDKVVICVRDYDSETKTLHLYGKGIYLGNKYPLSPSGDIITQVGDNVNSIAQHESVCSFNPDNRNCHSCKYSYIDGTATQSYIRCFKNIYFPLGSTLSNCVQWESKNIG